MLSAVGMAAGYAALEAISAATQQDSAEVREARKIVKESLGGGDKLLKSVEAPVPTAIADLLTRAAEAGLAMRPALIRSVKLSTPGYLH